MKVGRDWLIFGFIVCALVSGFTGAVLVAAHGHEATQLDHYCKSQDIQLEYNHSVHTTEDGLSIECVDDGEARDFLLTEEDPQVPIVTIHPPKDDPDAEDLELNVTTESKFAEDGE